MNTGTAFSLVILVLGSNLLLGLCFWVAMDKMARVLRGALEHNRELSRRLWVTETSGLPPDRAQMALNLEGLTAPSGAQAARQAWNDPLGSDGPVSEIDLVGMG